MKLIALYSTVLGATLVWPGAPQGFVQNMAAMLPVSVSPDRPALSPSATLRYATGAVEGVELSRAVTATGTW